VTARTDPVFQSWLAALEERHLRDLTFSELRRALQALSAWYVERRRDMGPGTALNSAGKRAAFALFFGPLHFLTVRRIVRELEAGRSSPSRILDLGCGTGAAGAAWAMEAGGSPILDGVDRSSWAAGEANWGWRRLGLRGRARRGDLNRQRLPARGSAILAAYTINELSDDEREALLTRLLAATEQGARLLVVEPIARRISPWWDDWSAVLTERAGRADTWRFAVALPEPLHRLDRAAGLDHRELTARSLYLPGSS
jgi:hypothetical protein